jgi:hypothetical protein
MKLNLRWIVMVLTVAVLLLSACARESVPPEKINPSTVEEIEGSEFKRVTVSEKAAERLGIQTAPVLEVQTVRNQTVIGEVVASREGLTANANQLWVRVPTNQMDIKLVARDLPAVVRPVENYDDDDDGEADDDDDSGWMVEPDEELGLDDDEEDALFYVSDTAQTHLVSGQHVFINLPLTGNGSLQKIVPYAALIYDTEGNTFVYLKETNALSFVRHSVTVDFIEGDLAYLTEGPAVNSEVVTVGVAELYGTETGVSK